MPTIRQLILVGAAVLAGCASQPPSTPGKYLVYRDANGTPIRQFDYPNNDFCAKVQSAAGRSARCQPDSIGSAMQAKATLMYNPPGVPVQSHYADLARCQADTRTMAPGVQLISACAVK
ncbi:MAG TPA: hypothetical protein VHA82_07315 [Ramlibacter sp.]|uniref:hypothetical protein n=1 Tax=Ramlibacter sp. TaxID=1917967 RepID=UPI002B86829E|nr:hypothetical protein [Ramlibacter sp.]HVZ43603.1 hypothetical protein [Ramlibacter sp.]